MANICSSENGDVTCVPRLEEVSADRPLPRRGAGTPTPCTPSSCRSLSNLCGLAAAIGPDVATCSDILRSSRCRRRCRFRSSCAAPALSPTRPARGSPQSYFRGCAMAALKALRASDAFSCPGPFGAALEFVRAGDSQTDQPCRASGLRSSKCPARVQFMPQWADRPWSSGTCGWWQEASPVPKSRTVGGSALHEMRRIISERSEGRLSEGVAASGELV